MTTYPESEHPHCDAFVAHTLQMSDTKHGYLIPLTIETYVLDYTARRGGTVILRKININYLESTF